MLWKLPCMADEPIRPQYLHQWWASDAVQLRAWQRGYTGYPLVDAGILNPKPYTLHPTPYTLHPKP
jgi:deoxyribodipyrimidine photolyase